MDSLSSIVASLPLLASRHYDLVCTGFYGHLITLPVGLFSRKNLLFDAFVSTYDTLVEDRREFAPDSFMARLARQLDITVCHIARHILLDTQTHADYFSTEFGISRDKLSALFVGCDDQLFYPNPEIPENSQQILYYSSYLPLHGVDTVLRAAKLLENRAQFRLIGDGNEFSHVKELAHSIQVKNIEFVPTVPLEDLPREIAKATVCLGGHFGASPKAARVIAGKTFQCLAMGKATIVGENPANHELLTHGKDAWFCSMSDPEALAQSIELLLDNPGLRTSIGHQARITFLEQASTPILQAKLRQIVERQFQLSID